MFRHAPQELTLSEHGLVSLVLLARPDATDMEHGRIVDDLRAQALTINVRTRPTPDGAYCEELESWKGRLRMGGYWGKERDRLLRSVLHERYSQEREAIERGARRLGFDYASAILEAEEERVADEWHEELFFPDTYRFRPR